MFETEQKSITTHIREFCAQHGLPDPGEVTWSPIPFSGEWGISTSFFQLAAAEARLVKERGGQGFNVPQRAQELAQQVAAYLGSPVGFSHIEALKGYLNLYFSSAEYAKRV
jgi:arginyl-tRNA synthetase